MRAEGLKLRSGVSGANREAWRGEKRGGKALSSKALMGVQRVVARPA